MKKTIVVLDLIRYSDIALQLEENLSAETVGQFNNQIQSFVDAGLAALGKSRNDVFIKPTGDGAIVGFDGAEEAHQFAHAVHSATEERNAKKTVESARRWFRIGAATGEVSMTTKGGTNDIAGVAVVRAVRLEGAAQIGEFLIDGATFEELPAQLREHYGDEEKVGGKRAEQFYARRCVMPRGGKGSKRAGLAILGGIVVVVVLLATFSIWKRPSMSSRESKSNQTSGIEGEWTVLSDRNATGAWRGYNRADFPYDLWTNEGSVLRTIHNSNAAPLVTKASFTNFILEFEYQMQRAGQASVIYNVTGHEDITPHKSGYVFWLIDDEQNPYKAKPVTRSGALYSVIAPDPQMHPDCVYHYVRGRLVVQDGRVEHWLDGRKVVEYEWASDKLKNQIDRANHGWKPGFLTNLGGHIAIYGYQFQTSFRDMRIKPLP